MSAETMTKPADLDIVEIAEQTDAAALYTDEAQFEALVTGIRAAVGEEPRDMSVKADREHLRTSAAKIAKVKTRVDGAGKDLTEEARKTVDRINGFRRRYKDQLQALQDETRAPLTEWEQAEKEREERLAAILNELKAVRDTPAPLGASAEAVADRLAEVQAQVLDAETFGEQLGYAEKVKAEAIEALTAAAERIRNEEAERAELEALRREKAEREAREQAEAEARARAEREEQERNQRIDAVINHLRACGEGLIDQAPAAIGLLEYEVTSKVVIDDSFGDRRAEAEAVRNEALAKIQKMKAEVEATIKANEAAERERAAENARREERERIERERRETEAQARAEREAEEKRAANKRHRARVIAGVAAALEAQIGLDGGQSQLIASAIAEGSIPRVSIQF